MSIALIGATIMGRLSFGIPKVIGTTAAVPAYVGKLFNADDITVMQLISARPASTVRNTWPPERYGPWMPSIPWTRFPEDELLEGARMYAEKMNVAKGPIKLIVSLKGWSSIDKPGDILHDPEQDQLLVKELKRHLNANIVVDEVDFNLEEMGLCQGIGIQF